MTEDNKKIIEIPEIITVKDFAERANLSVSAVISDLIKNGVLASINETIDFETASIIGDDFDLEIKLEEKNQNSTNQSDNKVVNNDKNLVLRPPVVTIMGHVDHGKTTLLDYIRKAKVAAGESGGITQHISAYQVQFTETKNKDIKNKTITFIDTPGHAAFSAMREHGATITDIIVLIVAANDGVMPQTLEVIKDAHDHNVPVIVAINKVDLPDADVMRVKQQLAEHELVAEDWGGKTVMVEISAKTGLGVDTLLEMILLQAEMMELKADPDEKAVGIVIESHLEKGAGPMATVLIENGTLCRCEPIAIGSAYGKVRILQDFHGQAIDKAGPSMPVQIAGLKSLPDFGARLLAFESDKSARENACLTEHDKTSIRIATAKKINQGEDTKQMTELNIVVKADVAGSLEAIRKMISEINSADYAVQIISEGVGAISESDVTLARATKALIVGFRVNVFGAAKHIAENEKITIKTFQVIYELIDFVKEKLADILPPEIIEEELGFGKVLAVFRSDKKGVVAGGLVENGKLTQNDEIKFVNKDAERSRTTILSLRKEKNEVKEVESGTECGFSLAAGTAVEIGDRFIAFKTISKKRTVK